MRRRLLIAAAAAMVAGVLPSSALAGPPGTMSLAEFLPRAQALQKKGMGAMFSSDLKPVIAEFKAAGQAYRADLDVARAAGRTDLGCPPPKGKAKITPEQIMADFSATPPAERATTTTKTAFYRMMRKRFPC